MRHFFNCLRCDNEFIAKRSDAKYCSGLCRKYASLERRRKKFLITRLPDCTQHEFLIYIARLLNVINKYPTDNPKTVNMYKSHWGMECRFFDERFNLTLEEACKKFHFPEINLIPPAQANEIRLKYSNKFYNLGYDDLHRLKDQIRENNSQAEV
jgi:hypothetical protein